MVKFHKVAAYVVMAAAGMMSLSDAGRAQLVKGRRGCPPAGASATGSAGGGSVSFGSSGAPAETAAEFVLNGDVWLRFDGFVACSDRATFDRASGKLKMTGNVEIHDPRGNVTRAENLDTADNVSRAFGEALGSGQLKRR